MLSGHRGLLRVVVHLESGFVHLHTPVTRASYFRRRCARRRVLHTPRYVLTLASRYRTVARHCTTTAAIVIGTATATTHRRCRSDCERDRDQDGSQHTDISCEAGVPAWVQKRVAEAKPMAPTDLNRSPWFPMQTRPRRTQCGVGADESFVTSAECARTRIPDAPLPAADRGTHLA